MLVGAHYYPWYHNNWRSQTLRNYIRQSPKLGWYNNVLKFGENSLSIEIVRKHFLLCKDYNIDFLLVSQKREDLFPYLDIAEEIGIKLIAHCETLGKVKNKKVTKEDLGKLLFDTPILHDWMHHPAWLKINNKPAIAYYVTRQIENSCLNQAIEQMRSVFGECFLIGDEVWWQQPDPNRIKLFDAIYSYNMYINKGQKMDKGKVVNKGVIGGEYLRLIEPYEKVFYEVAKQLKVQFYPTVLPGYNDRAVRYDADHYVIPREKGVFFEKYLNYSKKFLKDQILLVSSFNEWYEDTQIEPCSMISDAIATPETKNNLTQELEYEVYDTEYLEMLKSFKKGNKKEISKIEIKVEAKVHEETITVSEKLKELLEKKPEIVKSFENEELLDSCALLYYQTTILPILIADNEKKKDIQKMYFECTEEARRKGITLKQIKTRAKEITHYFNCNRSQLLFKREKG